MERIREAKRRSDWIRARAAEAGKAEGGRTDRPPGNGEAAPAEAERFAAFRDSVMEEGRGPGRDAAEAVDDGVIRLTVTVTDLKGPASARQINYIRALMKTAAARGYRFRAAELSGITGRQASGLIGLLKEVRKLPERRMPGVRVDTAKVLEKMREPGDEKRFVIKLRAEEEGKKEEDA